LNHSFCLCGDCTDQFIIIIKVSFTDHLITVQDSQSLPAVHHIDRGYRSQLVPLQHILSKFFIFAEASFQKLKMITAHKTSSRPDKAGIQI